MPEIPAPEHENSQPPAPVAVQASVHSLDWRSAAILAGAFGIVVVLLASIWFLARPITLLLAAIAIAQAFVPLVDRLDRHMPRAIAILILYLAVFIILGGIGWFIVPSIIDQAQEFADRIPEWIDSAEEWINRWDSSASERLTNFAETRISGSGGFVTSLPMRLVSTALEIFLVIAVSIYWLIAGPTMLKFTLSLFPEHRRDEAQSVLNEMGQTMGGYVRGTAIDAVVVGALAYAGYLIIGVEYPLVLALIAGLTEIIPILGPIIAAVPAIAVALLDSPTQAIIVLVFWVVLQQFENYVLLPRVMRSQAEIPSLLVIMAVFAGGAVGGLLGALVAIPVSGALQVFFVRVIAPAIRQWSGSREEVTGKREQGGNRE